MFQPLLTRSSADVHFLDQFRVPAAAAANDFDDRKILPVMEKNLRRQRCKNMKHEGFLCEVNRHSRLGKCATVKCPACQTNGNVLLHFFLKKGKTDDVCSDFPPTTFCI